MNYDVRQWPATVYPGEVDDECPEGRAEFAVLIRQLGEHGPAPSNYKVKPLRNQWHGLWQISFKVQGRQMRVLYAPYGKKIILFRIHKKASPQEQERAYRLAKKRQDEYEASLGTNT